MVQSNSTTGYNDLHGMFLVRRNDHTKNKILQTESEMAPLVEQYIGVSPNWSKCMLSASNPLTNDAHATAYFKKSTLKLILIVMINNHLHVKLFFY
jgi:hypothetical protein